MSRAFVKEPEGDQVTEDRPLRVHSDAPNYITPGGLDALQEHVARLEGEKAALAADPDRIGGAGDRERLDEDLAYYLERVNRAVVVATPNSPGEAAAFGARVAFVEPDGSEHAFTVVGEDEFDVAAGRISWTSPLGRALLGAAVGDVVTWPRPDGDREIEIVGFDYP